MLTGQPSHLQDHNKPDYKIPILLAVHPIYQFKAYLNDTHTWIFENKLKFNPKNSL